MSSLKIQTQGSMLQIKGGEVINKRRAIKAQKVPVAKNEEYEDKIGLSRVQSNFQINREIFSDSRTAALCVLNSMSLTTSNEENLNTKVVDLFVL
ncbi:hypothetical protein U9M48_009148 [Paspalum notatum var. saurae]|uniref:Uncharacterized protein n=1 Tax=Paspalum notatum var. saurae TaxID=547442 RepID=A0AAQ3WEJ2_PASNO